MTEDAQARSLSDSVFLGLVSPFKSCKQEITRALMYRML